MHDVDGMLSPCYGEWMPGCGQIAMFARLDLLSDSLKLRLFQRILEFEHCGMICWKCG